MPSQTQRSEPQILADLIRLLTRKESQIEQLKAAPQPDVRAPRPSDQSLADIEAEAELIEQARAALHRHVVAEGKAYLSRPRAPLSYWTGACFAAGATASGVAFLFGIFLPLCLVAGMLVVTGASIFIDRDHF